MTQETETVSQRARECAAAMYRWFNPHSVNAGEGVILGEHDKFEPVQTIARFERELSTNKDETIAKLREALEEILETREAEARADQVLDRQRRRHAPSSVVKESERFWIQAMARASDAESAARAALNSTKKEG